MRLPLDKALRKKLEDTVVKARDIVEIAVNEALQRLGVADHQAPSYLSEDERKLRNNLRAHARQLGDLLQDGKQEIELLANEMTYEHWHRMLFARYLDQNNLLMYDEHTAVTLEECAELAEEETDCKDGWELAGRLAQKMLPQIFRVDSPVFAVKLSINHINELESLIAKLDPATYQAQDSLGWCYQFWQTKKKDQVNKSGVKIGAQELSPVTQLFTEPYMVSFLLDNALGAWWANKQLSQDDLIRANNEQELRDLAAIPGVQLEYLRFTKSESADSQQKAEIWAPASGGFEKWPDHLSELKVLDPCCGSGHFLVAVFLMLVPMRMKLEGLTEKQAVDAVISENVHGLELDQRCVELAAFAIALEAWRYPKAGGYRVLPELQLACSGLSITEAEKEWKDLAKDDPALSDAVDWMKETFKDAPTLGSLIDPTKNLKKLDKAPWEVLQQAMVLKADVTSESKAAAQGLAKAAGLLFEKYHWVVTNVPYKKAADLCIELQVFLDSYYPAGCVALETAFAERCKEFTKFGGVNSIVVPQNWMFLTTYKKFRNKLLSESSILNIIRLGSGAFETISGEVVKALLLTTCNEYKENNSFFSLDVAVNKLARDKAKAITKESVKFFNQKNMLSNPDHRIVIEKQANGELFSLSTGSYVGLQNGDTDRFIQNIWEHSSLNKNWSHFQLPTKVDSFYSGRSGILRWEMGSGVLASSDQARIQGVDAWGNKGVAIRLTKPCPVTLYSGSLYDQSSAVLIPNNQNELAAIYGYVASIEFRQELEKIDQKRNVTNATFIKVPFNKKYWQDIATEEYPNGLPEPYTNDPTQWIFHGHPCESVIWDENTKNTEVGELRQDDTVLQIAVARLLGYQWPAELDPEMELAPEMREVMLENKNFAGLVDDDGIVCIPAVRGEKTAAKRLEAILYKAYGDDWTNSVEANLLKAVKANDLESWLRDKFFEQHCKLFQNRPFIWQIWDGHKDGFSALVNYHKLDYELLERLIYTYLDDWIAIQKRDIADGKDGADILLAHAETLREQLVAILQGESGLDIFVRWKTKAEQSIGWHPDLNDGVRLNIRPFMSAKDIGKKGAGVLRSKPNIHWQKDRGTDVESAPWYDLGLKYDGKQGDRINDHHLTLADKRRVREEANE